MKTIRTLSSAVMSASIRGSADGQMADLVLVLETNGSPDIIKWVEKKS